MYFVAGAVTTYAGSGSASSLDGTGTNSEFSYPFGLTIDTDDDLYVGDSFNHLVRRVFTYSFLGVCSIDLLRLC